jgi:hypothetical protein
MSGITSQTRATLILEIGHLLESSYVFPEIGKQMAEHLRKLLDTGDFDSRSKASEIGEQLTLELREFSNDLHLAVYYHPDEAAKIKERERLKKPDEPDLHWWRESVDNYGLQKLEILAGNIGYINLLALAPVALAGNQISAAMNFLSGCDALIFDLRECGGGDPYTVQLIESYLFGPKPKLLLTLYDRPKDEHEQIWTLPYVQGKRMPVVQVYILASGRTFSGGEDFTYTMKHHGRATIVGERTGGGGHTVEFYSPGEGFVLVLPTGYPTHPVTGSNWEGAGVEPDIAVAREKALSSAHLHALETVIQNVGDETKSRNLNEVLTRLSAIYEPLHLDAAYLKKLTGSYGSYEVTFTEGQLNLSRKDRQDGWKMIPITEKLFIADDEYNARFEINENGEVTALVWVELASGREIRTQKKGRTK